MDVNSCQEKRRKGFLIAALALTLGLTGCASRLERAPVEAHAVQGGGGISWAYRAAPFTTEGILAGSKGDYHLKGDAALLSGIWRDLGGGATVREDNVSPYLLIRLADTGTGRMNPLRGGPLSWDLQALQEAITASLRVLGEGTGPRYSIHLVALADDMRPLWSDGAVAQVRLRRLASVFIDSGVDPRVVSGQVWGKREAPEWKLAIVLRPFRYGAEQTSTGLVAPGSF